MLVARMALVTSSTSASPLVMGGVIGGITAVDSTLPAIRAPSMVFPHPAGSAGTLAAVIALVSADPAMVTPAGIAPEVSLLAASVAVVMALVSTAPSIVLPHDAVSAGIWVAATSCVTGSIGASRLCGAIIDVMNVPTAVEALNPADVSAGLANIARNSLKYFSSAVISVAATLAKSPNSSSPILATWVARASRVVGVFPLRSPLGERCATSSASVSVALMNAPTTPLTATSPNVLRSW